MFSALFCILFVLSALGGLRYFIPYYFEIAGPPFSEKSYLVLFQNEKQLTPSGGAITRYGIIRFSNGFFAGLEKKDTPIIACTDPDFTKCLPETGEIYDGIFAVNSRIYEKLKDTSFSPLAWRNISDIIVRGLNEKDIQLNFFSGNLQKKISAKGWSSKMSVPRKDFLAIVDSNISGNNVNQYIKRDIDYRVDLSDFKAKLTVTLENFAPSLTEHDDNTYKSELKIYLAPGTELQKAAVLTLPVESLEYAIYSTNITLKPGDRKVVDYTFIMSEEILKENSYHLDIIKQPGTNQDYYSVIVENPQKWTPASSDFEITDNTAVWRGFLNKDASLNFSITKNP